MNPQFQLKLITPRRPKKLNCKTFAFHSFSLVSACRVHIESLEGKRFRFIFGGRKFRFIHKKISFRFYCWIFVFFSRVKTICLEILFMREIFSSRCLSWMKIPIWDWKSFATFNNGTRSLLVVSAQIYDEWIKQEESLAGNLRRLSRVCIFDYVNRKPISARKGNYWEITKSSKRLGYRAPRLISMNIRPENTWQAAAVSKLANLNGNLRITKERRF